MAAESGRSLLVTGRAGTGKSTLLRRLRAQLEKQLGDIPVVAPTGIAALNVSGETLHRYFAFRQGLTSDLRNYRPPNHLGQIRALIIDEVSMVRADYFDMMSRALQRARDNRDAFGGVQVLLFGDLFQLPPVVTDRDRDALMPYSSEHFFASRAFRSREWVEIELTEVFRQRHQEFIELLNCVRDGSAVNSTIAALNSRVIDPETGRAPESAIVLTTTNRLAASENARRLADLGVKVFQNSAEVSGDVSLGDYKVEETVEFAVGAQVMMAVNTPNYVNGTIGRITAIDFDEDEPRVSIELLDSEFSGIISVSPHTWEVWRTENRTPRLVGAIRQLPFRLAWAVTVHRSQGQTFDNVVFNRGRGAFEAGQLYVALSRCRTLDGLYLTAPLQPRDVMVNRDVLRYLKSRTTTAEEMASASGRAYLGAIETDNGEYGKLLEVALILEGRSGEEFHLNTLINPMRDMSSSAAGLRPSDITLAPSIEDLRPLLACLLDGCVVATIGAGRVLDQIGWSNSDVSEGVWIDVLDLGSTDAPITESRDESAIELASRVRSIASSREDMPLGAPFRNLKLECKPGLILQARAGSPAVTGNLHHWPEAQTQCARILKVAAVVSDSSSVHMLRDDKDFLDHQPDYLDLAAAALKRLIAAASQDNRLSGEEEGGIRAFADAFGLRFEPTDVARHAPAAIALGPGLRVCLTGSPRSDREKHLRKPALREVLKKHGMSEADSVTRSGCDLVVALDASSMSGKAKQARKYGIPVLSSLEFLERLSMRNVD